MGSVGRRLLGQTLLSSPAPLGLGVKPSQTFLLSRELSSSGFVQASEVYRLQSKALRCSTGSRGLDKVLGGGVEQGSITEFYGEASTGKTQVCVTLSVLCQLKAEEGGFGGKVAYIDSEGTFRADRVSEIASARGLDRSEVLDNIFYSRAVGYQSLEESVLQLPHLLSRENVRLIVIDSIVSPFRAEFLGRESLQERQQRLGLLLFKLKEISEAYGSAVVITNQVTSSPNPFALERLRPAGGNVLAHSVTHRVFLYKKGDRRFAKLVDSPSLPQAEAEFFIGEAGVL